MNRISIAMLMTLAACGGSNSSTPDAAKTADADPNAPDSNPNAPDANPNAPDANPNAPDARPAANTTIFTILLENHDYAEIVSTKAGDNGAMYAPFINSLIKQYGLATNYKDTAHPSLPNYLHMISGDNQYPGGIDVGPNQSPWFPVPSTATNYKNIGSQMDDAGIKWRSYQESMGTPCKLTDKSPYATKHDPFLYFDNIQNKGGSTQHCKDTNVDYSQFAADLATNTYRYMWITPNLTDDGHDGLSTTQSLLNSDNWVKNNIAAIMNSDGYKNGGVIFLTWDEAEGRNNDDPDLIPMIVISPKIKSAGITSATAYTHSSYLATVEDLMGLPRLPSVTNEKSMAGDFLKP